MRIVSKEKDFYDGVMQHGMDLDLVYVRDNREDVLDAKYANGSDSVIVKPRPYVNGFTSQLHVIGFCGSIYPIVQIWKDIHSNNSYRDHDDLNRKPIPENMYPNLESIDALMEANLKPEALEKYYTKTEPKKARWWNTTPAGRSGWEKLFRDYEEIKGKFEAIFDKAKAPVFVISSGHRVKIGPNDAWGRHPYQQGIVYNPYLKNYAFAKVKDPYTAFQDIRMWLSNLASPEKEIVVMNNDDTAARLGHGDKYSFRTAPTKKR